MAYDGIPTTKRCSKCGTEKPLSEFGRNKVYSDGYRGQCNKCRYVYNKEWTKKWARTPKGKKYRRTYGAAHNLRYAYGLSSPDWHTLFEAQGSRCAICATDKPGGRWNRFVVDHCHKTGRIRGILCVYCNRKLAWLGDGLEGLAPFVDYLYATATSERRI